MNSFNLSKLLSSLIVAAALILVPALGSAESGSLMEVGEVSLVLGKAYRVTVDGSREQLERGTAIVIADRIITESNGHAHIRFVDSAMVSVRPNSELQIERYDYDPQNPEDSAVKFNLKEGVTRAISGDAARSARDSFRLNTPIAAIGVRGTDFFVNADTEMTRAKVYEGTIVVAPFSEGCSVDALGPCLTNALELAGNSPQLAALDQNAPLPRLLPAQNIRNPNMMQEELQLAIADNQTPRARVAANSDGEPEQDQRNAVLLESNTPTVAAGAEIAAVAALTPDDFTPATPLTTRDVADRQLVWGRFSFADATDSDRVVLAFSDASAGRQQTVGTLQYGLFRTENGPKRVVTDQGLVGFELDSAQAIYNSDTGVVAMEVNGGSLNIDFLNSAFDTELNLNHELTGGVDIIANGKLLDGGFLRAIEATQKVTGAVSLDGTEAGYLFERQLDNGQVSGLTLWNSQ